MKLLCIGADAALSARVKAVLNAPNSPSWQLDEAADLDAGLAATAAAQYQSVLLCAESSAALQPKLSRAVTVFSPLPVILLLPEEDSSTAELLAPGVLDVLTHQDLQPGVLARTLRLAAETLTGRQELQRCLAELEDLRRELQELQEFQRNVAIFAHEINSPLTGLLGFLQLIVEEVEEQEQDPDRAAMLRDSLEAATRIRRVMVKLHQITEPVFKKSRLSPRGLLELSQHGETIA